MKKKLLAGMSSLLFSAGAYALPSTGNYQRSYLRASIDAGRGPRLSGKTPAFDTPRMEPTEAEELGIIASEPVRELVIIDAAVPDKASLYRGIRPGVEIVEICANEPGLAQLASILAHYRNLAALHIVSHAADGEILLGSSRISAENIKDEAQAFAALDGALRDGADLLLYGCDLAAGIAGEELLDIIQRNTHLDVAASSNRTGSHALRGDWDLEIHAGDIEAKLPFSEKALKDFSAVLAAGNGTYDFSGFTDGGATLTSTNFIVSAKDSSGAPSLPLAIYGGSIAFIDSGAVSVSNYFYVAADGVNTESFELTGLAAAEYYTGEINLTNVRIVGILPNNSQIISTELDGSLATGDEDFIFGAGQLSNFAGVQLKAFKLYFDVTTRTPAGGGGGPFFGDASLFDFNSFTIANAQAPIAIPSTPDLDVGSDTGASSTDNITNDTTPTFTGTATADVTVTLFNDANSNGAVDVGELLGTGTATGGNWSITTSALSAGTYNVRAIASNGGGSSAASTGLSVTIDTTAPAAPSAPDLNASSDRGTSDTDDLTSDTTPTFTGTAGAGATVRLYANGTEVGTATADGAGNWSITSSPLDEGTYNITARAEDAVGNLSTASSSLSVTIDNTAPVVSTPDLAAASDSGSSNTDNLTNVRRPEFTGTAPAGTLVRLFIDNAGNGTPTDPLNEIIGTGTAGVGGTWSITATVDLPPESISSIKADGQDDAGNVSVASSSVNVTVDIEPPEAVPSAPNLMAAGDTGASNTDNITSETAPLFFGTGSASTLIRLYANDELVGSATSDSGGNWNITPPDALAAGTYTFTARTVDLAGNEGTASTGLSVTIDTAAPAAPSTPDMDAASDTGNSDSDNNTEDTTPTFSGTGAEANATVYLYVGGVEVGESTADGSGNWSVSVSAGMALDAGDYSVVARTIDAAGNLSAASGALPIHINTAPTANGNLSQTVSYTEDPGGSVALGDIVVSDVDPGEAITATLTLSDPAAGALSSGTYGSATSTFDADTGVWTVTGSVADVNAALAAVAFTPAANWDQNVTITTRIRDANGSGPAAGTIALNVTGVNDDPSELSLSHASVNQSASVNAVVGTLSTTDVDAGDTHTYSLVAGTGDTANADFNISGDTLRANNASAMVSGSHSVRIQSSDGAATYATALTIMVVDDIPPGVPSTPDLVAESDTGASDTDNITSDTTPTFSGTAENGNTITLLAGAIEIGTATVTDGTWTITSSVLGAGAHSITATATDAEDNTSAASAALSITVDSTAPDLQSIQRQTPATVNSDAASLTWRVTFDSDISGLDTTDFTLTAPGSSTATGTVASVTAVNASTYDVVVNALGGQGQLRLDLNATGTGIADLTGQALTDGGFTTGDFYIAGVTSVFETFDLADAFTVNANLAGPNQPAQRFTTSGTEPLTLSTVTVALGAITGAPAPVVTIHDDNANSPGNLIATFVNPAALAANSLNVWTGNATLEPNTVYWVVFGESDALSTYDIDASTDTTGGTGGWLTGSDFSFRYGANSGTTETGALQMALGATSTPAISSALTSNATYGAAFTYSITASNTPTSYAATGLPAGLTLDTATGAITGEPTAAGSFNVALTATNGSGTGAPSTLVLTVTKAPLTITANDASRSYGEANPAFTVAYTGLVAGDTGADLTTAPTVSTIADATSAVGTYDITVAGAASANYTFTYVSGTLTINAASQTISFPAIGDTRPGETVELSATSSSGLPVTFSLVSGNATLVGSTLTIDGGGSIVVNATQAGNANYQAAPAVTRTISSNKVAQTITFAALPDRRADAAAFTLSATASSGLPVTFTVASGPAMLSGNTLTLTGVPGSVVIRASQAGDDTYAAAPSVSHSFDVAALGPQIFFGSLGSEAIAAQLSSDGRSGTLIGIIPGTGEGFVVNFSVNGDGTWTATVTTYADGSSAPTAIGALQVGERVSGSRRKAVNITNDETESLATFSRTFRGSIQNGVLSGTIDGLDLDFTANLQPASGSTAGLAGYYEAPSLNSATGSTYSIVGTDGDVYVLVITASAVVGTQGEVAPDGSFTIETSEQVTIVGNVDAPSTSVTGTILLPNGEEEDFSGVRDSTLRTDRLINLSTRARITATQSNDTLITGFVVGGTAPKQVLLRGVGPTLANFGISDALANPHLQVFDATGGLVASNDDWTASTEVKETMQRVGAFALPEGSKDAALVLTLDPGAYTMHVRNGGSAGLALAEIYDASANPSGEYQRLVNISSRGHVAGGEGVLIGGFIVTGNAPKRILVRGAGPSLAAFNVQGTLADPEIAVIDDKGVIIARNDNWETPAPIDNVQVSATAAEISVAGTSTGAFAFPAGSRDAALVVTLQPGIYTVHLRGVAGATGTGLIEVYEVAQ